MRFIPVALILALLMSLAACDKTKPEPLPAPKTMESKVASKAGIAAALHVEAERACKAAGIADVGQCADSQAPQLRESNAQRLAVVAQQQIKRYFDFCMTEFPASYCNVILARAIGMAVETHVVNDDFDY
jgi:hypothetical protein